MNKDLKQTLAFIINLNSQILKNQINAINGNLTTDGYKKSEILVNDCVEVIRKLGTYKETKSTKIPDDAIKLFNYWLERGLTQHKKIDGFIRGIKTGLKNTSCSELMDCIDRYSLTFFDKESTLSYVWSVDEFCSSKYKRFETDERVEANYYKRYNGSQTTQQSTFSDEESINIARNAQKQVSF